MASVVGLPAKFIATSTWSAASTLTANGARSRYVQAREVRVSATATSGGASETGMNAVTVAPCGSPSADRQVITVTPVAKRPKAALRLVGSIGPPAMGTGAWRRCRTGAGDGRAVAALRRSAERSRCPLDETRCIVSWITTRSSGGVFMHSGRVATSAEELPDFSAAVAEAYFPHELTVLREGAGAAELRMVDLGPVRLTRIGWGAEVSVRSDHPGGWAVNVPRSGVLDARVSGRSVLSLEGQATVCPPDTQTLMSRWSADCSILGVRIDADYLADE